MNVIQFGKLIHAIYSRNGKLPDLDWIQSQGLFAVKLAQIHALRIDFLDRKKCEHLATLYRQANAVSSEDFLSILSRYAPSDYMNHFESIDAFPLATASVGQVHKAQLKSGNTIVIKAIKAEVSDQFNRDVTRIKKWIRFATWIYPKLKKAGDTIGIIEDIERYTLSELDLRHEAKGQMTLRNIHSREMERFDLSMLKFANVHPHLSNKNLMVSDYISGPTFDELLTEGKLQYRQLLDLFRIQGYYMFCVGTFHGDLHPGNVILSGDQMCFIDTGLIAEVRQKMRIGLFNFFETLSSNDYEGSAHALNRMSENEIQGSQFRTFSKAFKQLYQDFKGASVAEISLTQKMMQTIKLGIHAGMSFDRDIFCVIRSLMYLDGMVLRCNPNAILLEDMRPYIAEFKRNIQNVDPSIR